MKRIEKITSGYTLIEVLLVVAVVGILAAIAYPSYRAQVMKGKRSDCQSFVMDTASRLERFYFDNNSYTVDMTDIGYGTDDDVSTPEGSYTVDVLTPTNACPIGTCYVLQCTAVGSQVDDGNLTLSSSGEKLPTDKW